MQKKVINLYDHEHTNSIRLEHVDWINCPHEILNQDYAEFKKEWERIGWYHWQYNWSEQRINKPSATSDVEKMYLKEQYRAAQCCKK